MSDQDYNPNSVDAVLARIETRQIENGAKLDSAILIQSKHEERIQSLEGSRKWLIGACAAISCISPNASKWLLEKFSGQ